MSFRDEKMLCVKNKYFCFVSNLKSSKDGTYNICDLCQNSINSKNSHNLYAGPPLPKSREKIKANYLINKYNFCERCWLLFLVCPICGKINDINEIKEILRNQNETIAKIKYQFLSLYDKLEATKSQKNNVRTGIPCCNCMNQIEKSKHFR